MAKFVDKNGLKRVWEAIKNRPGGDGTNAYLVKAPVGTIVIWSGTVDDIPTGWHLCDGTDGTPDLRDKFVLGAGENHPVNDKGGSEEVVLTLEQMPRHSHGIQASSSSGTLSYVRSNLASGLDYYAVTTYSGLSEPHPNMPPYYSLCYIMKLSKDETDSSSGGVVNWEDINGRPDLSNVSSMDVVQVVLQSNLWDHNNRQPVAIRGVLADENRQLIIPTPQKIYETDYYSNNINCVEQDENLLVFHSDTIPSNDIHVNIFIFSSADIREEVTPTPPKTKIYGVRWSGGPETTMSRTDDAEEFIDPDPFVNDGNHPGYSPFDDIMPWSGMEQYEDPVLGSLVSIPKYWYKWEKTGTVLTLRISNNKQEGFSVSPAHADRGDGQGERDIVYVGRYHCNSSYRSASGETPKVGITRSAARDAIHALDKTAWQYDFAMFWTINMLYLVEFADWDALKVIGYGCGNGSIQSIPNLNNMSYHTGTLHATRDTYGVGCQYRYINGLWENIYQFIDGIRYTDKDVYVIDNPNYFSDTQNGSVIGPRFSGSGLTKSFDIPTMKGFEWALHPSDAIPDKEFTSDDYTTYIATYYSYNSNGVFPDTGRNYQKITGMRLNGFCLIRGIDGLTTENAYTGCRLMKLPNKGDV